MTEYNFSMGPQATAERTVFRTWAPFRSSVFLILGDGKKFEMHALDDGFWEYALEGKHFGARYAYVLDGDGPFPDPSSRYQPDGVLGFSQVVDTGSLKAEFRSPGLDLGEMVIEEIHVGTFTGEGTFRSAEEKIPHLVDMGVNAVELMPVAQFYGSRNWGYDGVYLYAPQNSYGRPEDLAHLVSEMHKSGISVILDVVYNHLGPVGNYFSKFGPFYSERYTTPWGRAINYDGPYSDPVRNFMLENASYWLTHYCFDGLRLDAIHGIIDNSPKHILAELSEKVEKISIATGRRLLLIAESDLNDPRVVNDIKHCGYGLTAQWNDDYHHSIHTMLTGEHLGYYGDYTGAHMVLRALRNGYVYTGQYSRYLHRLRGSEWGNRSFSRLIVFSQNHDQVGNRAFGERLSSLVDEERLKTAAGLVLLSPFTPMLFMGEEYGETAPFLFFVDTDDAAFAAAIREGRRMEFSRFGWEQTPDPNALSTFEASKLKWNTGGDANLRIMQHYRALIDIRRKFIIGHTENVKSSLSDEGMLEITYSSGLKVLVNTGSRETKVHGGFRRMLLDSGRNAFGGLNAEENYDMFSLKPFSLAALLL
jgi:maltooligosyltrehalose trehalohydrolase